MAEDKESYASEGIPGWMAPKCLDWLRALGRGKYLGAEAGCWKGRSTSALCSDMLGKLYAIDTWAGVPDDPKQHDQYFKHTVATAFDEFLVNLNEPIRRGKVIPRRMTSLEGAKFIRNSHGSQSLDFAFIDADHRYEAVLADIKAYQPLIKKGGILAGHDYRLAGVKKAVDKSFGKKLQRGPGSIWYIKIR